MDEKPYKPNPAGWQSRALCVGLLMLLSVLYFGSYRLLLIDDPPVAPRDEFILVGPWPKPCYREEYSAGGEAVRLFYWPANRLHRFVDRYGP